MSAWWDSLGMVQHIFYGVAFFGIALLVLQTAMILLGAEISDLFGASVGHDGGGLHPSGLEMLSLRTIAAFCTGFGWGGIILFKACESVAVAAIVATLIGMLLAWSIVWLMRSMRRLESDGSMSYANAIGAIGTVVVSTQPEGTSGGQVEVMIQGRLAVVAAVADPAQPVIASGVKVKVLALTSTNALLVCPV